MRRSFFGGPPAQGEAPPAYQTWCLTPHKTLFFRRQAPRLPGSRRRRRTGRGASLSAKPCSFVVKHHVFGAQGAAGVPDVVLRLPQALVLSSSSTTSLGPKALPAYRTWCLTPRKPLFLRRQAPHLWRRLGRPPASHPKSDAGALVFLFHASTPFSRLMHEHPFFSSHA